MAKSKQNQRPRAKPAPQASPKELNLYDQSATDDVRDDDNVLIWQYIGDVFLPITTHVVLLTLYLIPICFPQELEVVFDEFMIFAKANVNVWNGIVSLHHLFTTDYWGMDMRRLESNRSWRPMSIASFGLLKTYADLENVEQMVFVNRVVNIVLHACVAELVSILAVKLFVSSKARNNREAAKYAVLRALSKLLFGLNHSHVEVAINGANRAHVLGMLCSLIVTVDDTLPLYLVNIVFTIGLLSCESVVFHMPAVVLTLLVSRLNREHTGKEWTTKSVLSTAISMLPRLVSMIGLTLTYLVSRYYLDFLSIHQFMFQDIISPFYNFTGLRRFWNYVMVTSIHFLKGLYLDPVGVAHEYGYGCVPELSGMTDLRLLWPFVVFVGFVGTASFIFLRCNLKCMLYYLVFAAWFATLFPITGLITTGTFIADRLVVPCTVASSIYIARGVTYIIFDKPIMGKHTVSLVVPVMLLYLAFISEGTFKLTKGWTTRINMLRMTLDTCPNNVKAITEMGIMQLQPEKYGYLDAELSYRYLQKAQDMNEDYDSIHFYKALACQHLSDVNCYEEEMIKAVASIETHTHAISYFASHLTRLLNASNDAVMKKEVLNHIEGRLFQLRQLLSVKVPQYNKYLPQIHHLSVDGMIAAILKNVHGISTDIQL